MQGGCFIAEEDRYLFYYPLSLAINGLIDPLALSFAHSVMHLDRFPPYPVMDAYFGS
jgi:hypothetical protein